MPIHSRVPITTCVLCLGSLFLVGCAAGSDQFTADNPAGFWMGLWHGLIAWVTLILGIFYDGVEVYERHNRGGWYDLGFLLGVMLLSGTGHRSHRQWSVGKGRKGRIDKGGATDILSAAHIPAKGSARLEVSWDRDEEETDDSATESPRR